MPEAVAHNCRISRRWKREREREGERGGPRTDLASHREECEDDSKHENQVGDYFGCVPCSPVEIELLGESEAERHNGAPAESEAHARWRGRSHRTGAMVFDQLAKCSREEEEYEHDHAPRGAEFAVGVQADFHCVLRFPERWGEHRHNPR